MISDYFIDTIRINQVTYDINGVKTETLLDAQAARVEDVNTMVRNREGQEVTSNALILTETQNPIKYEDQILIITKNGSAYPLAAKKNAILKLSKEEGFATSHYEVYL